MGSAVGLGTAACVLVVVFAIGQGLARASLLAAVIALPVGVAAMAAAVWPQISQVSGSPRESELRGGQGLLERAAEKAGPDRRSA